ncbi:tRNA-specific adenosine-34 deaminase subunit Tad3 [Paecilomyces variotii No. 5]|uniref:tRNA-specific adenosine-34 deaminase subunit Tad3 n=1 Tax=Byssochlamys spectabilis (strain No. 5 / NBRC 109023) TaxID=1356009 RepID=V5I1C8_BYSSN|nr:tRNA-specific adenosine-34 deaminase subunit Tad3 [Paecilomyces variotii No. 5]
MDTSRILESIQPLEGDAYVAEVNVKSASAVTKVLDAAFPKDPALPLQHLRRFVKRANLPQHLRESIVASEGDAVQQGPPQTIYVLIPCPLPDVETVQNILAPYAPLSTPSGAASAPSIVPIRSTRIPLQPPLNPRQAEQWSRTLWPVTFNPAAQRALVAPPPPILNKTRVSIQSKAGHYLALARRVAVEAEQPGRGRGVGAVVVDPEIEIDENDEYGWTKAIVAVAGDARYTRSEGGQPSLQETQCSHGGPNPASKTYNPDLEGGPELHALMRVTEMIAKRRREEHDSPSRNISVTQPSEKGVKRRHDEDDSPSGETSATPVSDKIPLTPLETSILYSPSPFSTDPTTGEPSKSRIRPRSLGGYLCTGLDLYITNEPCLSCCMGMLLSRFRLTVFPRSGRMVVGGLASEPVVSPVLDDPDTEKPPEDEENNDKDKTKQERHYYGLHWRKELNWRALGFEFIENDTHHKTAESVSSEKKVNFHA